MANTSIRMDPVLQMKAKMYNINVSEIARIAVRTLVNNLENNNTINITEAKERVEKIRKEIKKLRDEELELLTSIFEHKKAEKKKQKELNSKVLKYAESLKKAGLLTQVASQ